jgi:hypothetical protein
MGNGISDEIIELHYRYRFDPAGLNEQEKNTFQSKVNIFLSVI